MEPDVFEFILCHLQNKLRIGQEYIAAQFVFGHFLVFSFFKLFQHFGVVRFNPAGLIHLQWFEPAFGVVFVLQPNCITSN
jgi:hypothetical protein